MNINDKFKIQKERQEVALCCEQDYNNIDPLLKLPSTAGTLLSKSIKIN
jgi:hypothetical protein